MANCIDCCRQDLPEVPGTTILAVAHVDQRGQPCLDGRRDSLPGESCTEHGVRVSAAGWHGNDYADASPLVVVSWQANNLNHLNLEDGDGDLEDEG